MKFSIINFCGVIIVALMLLPNIIYAIRHKGMENKCKNKAMNALEQIGRYAAMLLMVLPIGVWKFGFPSAAGMVVYLVGNGVFLLSYLIIWVFYFKKTTIVRALALAVLPTAIFLNSGLMLRHWLLVGAALCFGVGHVYVTWKNCPGGDHIS